MNTENKFKLGPIQKEWIRRLREHPERQTEGMLAAKVGDSYKACCLGEGLLTLCEANKIEPMWKTRFDSDTVYLHSVTPEDDEEYHVLKRNDFEGLGLRDQNGSFEEALENYACLTEMNDDGVSWSEIADYIEQNPENVFVKSV